MVYYNENDKFAAAWLRELIADDLIAKGDVDERSISDVLPADLRGYRQCHFFAGIGGWSYALRLAGWPDDRAVWTGSCPCQSFSVAGTGAGFDDPRHLWPVWFNLIEKCRPPVLFGEQVPNAIQHGWLDLVCFDLEREGYAIGSLVLGAASVGAFHKRQRLYFVADAEIGQRGLSIRAGQIANPESIGGGEINDMENPVRLGRRGRGDGDTTGDERTLQTAGRSASGDMGNALLKGLERHSGNGYRGREPGRNDADTIRPVVKASGANFWADAEYIPCLDGKTRPIPPAQSGIQPLAHGIPHRMGLLRGAGNSICPQTAAEFIKSYMEVV